MYNDHDDLQYLLHHKQAIPPQSSSGTVTGSGQDMLNTGAFLLAVIDIGAVTSGGTGTVTLESSTNDNTADAKSAADAYTAITGASATYSGTDANTKLFIKVNSRNERYV